MERTNSAHILQRLKQAGVWSKKHLGQHFLVDSAVLATIEEIAGLKEGDTVIEIGPGLGVLSEVLLGKAKRVIAFELDPEMIMILRQDLPSLEIVGGDVLQTAPPILSELGTFKVVANIPYQITTPLIKLFLEGELHPESLTLLVQKEVGQRLAAAAGKPNRGYLSVLTQYFTEIQYIQDVPPSAFWPEPAVDSGIIHMNVKSERPLEKSQEIAFLKMVRQFFTTPRKQLKNVVGVTRRMTTEEVLNYFGRLGLPANVRAQQLSEAQWLTLFQNPL